MLFCRVATAAIASFFIASCSDDSISQSRHFQILEGSLAEATKRTARDNETIYHSLYEKRMDPATHYKATVWEPKAAKIRSYAAETRGYIEGLKKDLKRMAAPSSENAVADFFQEGQKGIRLDKQLKAFKTNILAVDTLLREEFSKPASFPKPLDSLVDEQGFSKRYFENTNHISAQALLSQLSNSMIMAENELILFCNEQIPNYSHGYFSSYSVIIGQSSSYVRAGEEIKITAGVGAFSQRAQPKITIAGDTAILNEYATTDYPFKASKKPGKHFVPVKIEFIDQDGKMQTIKKNVEYTVAKE